jgi:Ca-activated chloride channel family protein
MKFLLLIPLWLLIPYTLLVLGAAGWQIWQIRTKSREIRFRWIRRSVIVLLPAVLALGPSIPGGTSAPGVSNLDVIFAVDVTPSMGAVDYTGAQQRIDGVKKDLLAMSTKLQGARLEIITFDSAANVVLSFTSDASAFSSAVQGITPQISSYSPGSSIDKPVQAIAHEFAASKSAHPEHQRILFYMGDGEQTTTTSVQSFDPITPYLNGGAVLGYGTTVGSKMINYTGAINPPATPSYITTIDPSTKTLTPAISKIDETALRSIADQLKIPYQNRNQGGSADGIYQASRAALAVDRSQHLVHYLNLYWFLAIPFTCLIFWEWQQLIVKLFDLRKRPGGSHA